MEQWEKWKAEDKEEFNKLIWTYTIFGAFLMLIILSFIYGSPLE